jgi:hypothetical protein
MQVSAPLQAAADQFGRSSRGIDATFRRLEASVPGFGGYFLNENGVLVAYLKNPSNAEALRSSLQSMIVAREEYVYNPLESVKEIEIRQGQYSYSELSDWQSALSQSFGRIEALSAIDADEAHNKLAIAIIDPTAESTVIAEADSLGIPREALSFRLEEEFDSRTATLQNVWTTVAGGVQLTDGITQCSVGFNSHPAGWDRYLITASHCVNDGAGTTGQTGTGLYQPTTSGNYIADVDVNVPWNYSSPSCGTYTLCTTSDVLRAVYLMTFSSLRVKITGSGSITVTGEDTVKSVTTATVGLSVTRVGSTTGSNTSTIVATCENRVSTGSLGLVMNLCVDRTNGSTAGGDSGGSVTVRLGSSRASMVGISLSSVVAGGYTLTNHAQIIATIGSFTPY